MSEHSITKGPFAGWRLRIRSGEAQALGGELAKWTEAPLRKLARDYAAGEGPWPWLLEQGIRRPQPSGRTSGAPLTEAQRAASGKKRVNIWLTEDEAAALEQRRKGRSVRDTIGAMLMGKV